MEESASSSEDEDMNIYLMHNAAEAGNIEAITTLLESEDELANLRVRDVDQCTPLHLSLLHGHLDVAAALLDHCPTLVNTRCEGALPLHMVACLSALPARKDFSIDAVHLLLKHEASPFDRDDQGRLPLHWAAASGSAALAQVLLDAAHTAMAKDRSPKDGEAEQADPLDGIPVTEARDKQGNTALHLGARSRCPELLSVLLQGGGSAAAHVKNHDGQLPLHVAAKSGHVDGVKALMQAEPSTLVIKDLRGLTAQDWAAKRGHQDVVAAFGNAECNGHTSSHGAMLLVAPDECHMHNTCPFPILRGSRSPPPENINRLHVLTDSELGILRSTEFADLQWETQPPHARISDILRVHEWSYVRELQNACAALGEHDLGHLDGDTAISAGSFRAALAAAGAVIAAVDRVVKQQVRSAFCAVRPPGHHAGPTGLVTCANDPHGSHGFCLFSNLAIGAAYAMTQHQDAGIRRVALLDFDVHHGNGTQACIGNTVPSLASYAFHTPLSKGSQTFPQYKPWRDFDDPDNIFFASVQGYGQPEAGRWFYPGSGATGDTRPPPPSQSQPAPSAAPGSQAADGGGSSSGVEDIEEDPDGEFSASSQAAGSPLRIINVGIPGPGARVPTWRRAWRDKILPALVRFDPDLIFISAGFDAHRKDSINNRFIGIQEKDYEWLTSQIVQVANRCCEGRIVSVLEGGYRIHGLVVSAFSRSVAAHLRALAEPNHQRWDAADWRWEREYERQQRLKAEAAKQAALEAERAAMQQRLALLAQRTAAEQAAAEQGSAEDATAPSASDAAKAASPNGVAEGLQPDRKRRRRSGTVDYKALDEQLRAEHEAQGDKLADIKPE
ncbi:probable type-2 histone deacetylase 2 at C-terminar half [Coccomyxa sp. Obi]|nr:probable type-2 histone deacetylase 2 at C-terminar half [Coccomyxa sp. Obi]